MRGAWGVGRDGSKAGRRLPRSAGFQPAVSQSFQPAECTRLAGAHLNLPTPCRLEIGDTAGWKPALHLAAALALAFTSFHLTAAEPSKSDLEFFESKIRPILTENCYKCHSHDSEKIKGGLLLDTRDGLLKGGDDGPVIVPGDPEKSMLIKAVRYTDKDLQMPPNDRQLSANQIQDLETWVKMGVPDPRTEADAAQHKYTVNMDQARKHWAFQPVTKPAVPQPADPRRWVQTPVDNFVLAMLHGKGTDALAARGQGDKLAAPRHV